MKGNASGTRVTGVNAWSFTSFHASSPWKLRGRIWGHQMATLCQSISPACVWKQSLLDFPVTAAVEDNDSRTREGERPLFVSISYSIRERNSAITQHYLFYRHKHQISGDGNNIKHADVAAAFSRGGELWEKKEETFHYHNSGEHWWQSAVYIIMSFILDNPTTTTGSKLWLIKATEPFNCARYSEEQGVIQRHSHSKANLKTCEWKTATACGIFWFMFDIFSPFGWDMTFRALTLLLNISSILQCKRTQKERKKKSQSLVPAPHSIHPIY